MKMVLGVVALAGLVTATQLQARQDFSAVQITTQKLAAGVYMLVGSGGNIGVSAGEDGIVIIDDQFAPLAPKIRAALATLSDKPVRFVINTHWHRDHTGGNEAFGKAGSVIVAHGNVRKRMGVQQSNDFSGVVIEPSPKEALPVVTFDREVTRHYNGEDLEAMHVENAHTDGDAIIRFRNSNVVHMGDTYFNGFYPFIDDASGGSVNGMIAAVDRVLAIVDGETKIIPGHGPLATRTDLQGYRDLLATVRDRVAKLIGEGSTPEQVLAAQPTKEFDEKWGGGFLKPDQWVQRLYADLKRTTEATRRKQ